MNPLLRRVAKACLMLVFTSPVFAQDAVDLFARDSYRIDTIVCPFKGEIDYEPGDIECGLLEVPENREDPDSRFIELHFVKLNSRWGKDDEDKDDEEGDSGLAPGKREYPVLGAAIGSAESYDRGVALCLEMGMPQRPAEEYSAVQTSLPALIIEGAMDPITPPPNAKAILPGFENGTYVEFPYAGHGPSRSVKCAGGMLNKFYDNPSAEPDLSCVDEMEEPQIWAQRWRSRPIHQNCCSSSDWCPGLNMVPGAGCLLACWG